MKKTKYLFGSNEDSRKLKQGDYCKNITKEQFKQLLIIEEPKISHGLMNDYYTDYLAEDKIVGFDGYQFYHEFDLLDTSDVNELSFEVFKSRASNTFKK